MQVVNDLLDPRRGNLKLREDPKRGFFIEGIKEETLVSAEHALSIIAAGDAHRKVPCCLPDCWPCHKPCHVEGPACTSWARFRPASGGLSFGSCFGPSLLLRQGRWCSAVFC